MQKLNRILILSMKPMHVRKDLIYLLTSDINYNLALRFCFSLLSTASIYSLVVT